MSATVELEVAAVHGAGAVSKRDAVAVEEPLELRVQRGSDAPRALTLTMRTPGEDDSLALGFLFAESVIASAADVMSTTRVEDNVISLGLAPHVASPFDRAERRFTTTSACGVCGKTSLEALDLRLPAQPPAALAIDAATLHALPRKLREAQSAFQSTGGLHATALFDATGALVALHEDVGRHNAMDKTIGAELRAGRIPLRDRVLLVSGRASFELVQKAAMAGCPILAAIGAPSSLAVELAARAGMTLVGFLRDDRFNVYAGTERIRETSTAGA